MGSIQAEQNANECPVLFSLPHDDSLPPFLVSTERGFLPRVDPPTRLPSEFDAVENLLQRMSVTRLDGSPGLLATFTFGETVDKELPDLTDMIDKYQNDLITVNALYRDYSFIASAYLLEPCHQRFVRNEPYGLGRDHLPKQVSKPIVRVAEILKFKPFMEYAGSYALYNYRMEEPSKGMDYDNLRLIRAFEHGLDPKSSEGGFVLVHVEMVKHTGPLVAGAVEAIKAVSEKRDDNSMSKEQRLGLNQGLHKMNEALRIINNKMDTMWAKSKPNDYTQFRTFIFGITSQSMFPRGVLYEGVFDSPALADPGTGLHRENVDDMADENEKKLGTRLQYRGESGANDSIVPLCDNLLQIPMPTTPLTEILKDFRKYRPSNHRQFLEWVNEKATKMSLREKGLALGSDPANTEGLLETRKLWLLILDKVREFRWRHWCFAREYILKQTSHPTATGGSPIVTWLPNQLGAVLDEMSRIYEGVGGSKAGLGEEVDDIMDLVVRQSVTLKKEVEKYCAERGVKGHGIEE